MRGMYSPCSYVLITARLRRTVSALAVVSAGQLGAGAEMGSGRFAIIKGRKRATNKPGAKQEPRLPRLPTAAAPKPAAIFSPKKRGRERQGLQKLWLFDFLHGLGQSKWQASTKAS